ncbi:putative tyrosinase-like protein [Dirofilaria immitis]
MNEADIILVYIPNGAVKSVRYNFEIKVQKVIHVLLSALGIDRLSFGYFALRLIRSPVTQVCSNNNDCHWLHSGLTMRHVYDKFFSKNSSSIQLRFELRLRFISKDLQEMYQTETDAFMFLHDQILADYVTQVSWKVPAETAIELAALQIRRKLGNQNSCNIEKYLNLDELEAEGTLARLLPETMLINIKSKMLRKTLIAAVKKHALLTPIQCIFHFLEIVKRITQFDIEIFKASLGMIWKNPLDIMVGMAVGISCAADGHGRGPILLAKLQYIISLTLSKLDERSEKTVVNLKITGSLQQLSITLPTWSIAESLAHLINGYHMLMSQQGCIWTPIELMDELKKQETKILFVDDELAPSEDVNLLVDRSRITLEELLGDGQFGNVYRGTFMKENGLIDAVAVKVCKIDSEAVDRQNFLEEAFIMHRFHHEHIIALVGICIEKPIWIVIELAPLGELRQYLLHNTETIDLSIQLLFSQQLSSALSYLHSCKYVHRDIAARNVLLSTPRCVKLSDFGLSRCVEEDNVYTASRGKLPIKWMAPESINYRCFSKATDVWMFGVCIWEILTFGIKPWQGVRNHNVILKIESGERLERPDNCPQVLYDLMLRMWNFEALKRPTMFEVNHYLGFLLDQIDCSVPFRLLKAPFDNKSNILVQEESRINGFRTVAPVLKVDSATMPASTLWRTLEQQRIQSEEDDRWLEEEEEKLLPLPALSTIRAQYISSLSRKQPLNEEKNIPSGYEFDRRDDTVHGAVFRVIGAITNLSKEFHITMTNERFIECIKIITDYLENLFSESFQHISILTTSDQQEVKLVETLLESDLRNLTGTMKKILDEDISKEAYEALRREVLKISHRLAFNCKQFLETIDSARIRSGVAKLQLKDASLRGAQEFPNPCDDAPSASARIICNQLHEWDRQARAKPPVGSVAVLPPAIPGRNRMIAAQLAPITSTPYQCLDLECLCTYLRGRIQAELKRSGEYDKLALIHGRSAVSGGAHSGPAFLPWHREFIKRFEIALRQIDPSVSIPYWDSVLDSGLPNPEDSVMWTIELMGTTDAGGAVTGGDFANFDTFEKHPHIRREVGRQGSPFKESDLNWFLRQNRMENVLAFTAPRQGCQYRANYNALEYTHGNVHIFVGGDMYDPYTSGNDPVFYLHHSFVDYIWEMYRQQKQTRYQRENDYSPDNQACSSALHFGSTLMRPFQPLRNIDGLSNAYTDNLYEFAPRPTCRSGSNCGSKYLFCDRSHGQPHCVSQARIGGRCSGFVYGEQVCHNGICSGGRCVATSSTSIPSTTSFPITISTRRPPVVSILADCYNENECCQFWAQHGECDRNEGYMQEWCKVSCRVCKPNFNPNIECSDHHENCDLWARSGECTRNAKWMKENCRQSCRHCSRTRAEICGGGRRDVTITTRRPRPEKINALHCNSPGCYNENVCCPLWGLQGQCSRNATWLACNCKVSCGLCIPDDYDYGTCNDYHRSCKTWASRGECDTNAWMLENCRRSCHSCFDQWELRQRCRINSDLAFHHEPTFVIADDYYYDLL